MFAPGQRFAKLAGYKRQSQQQETKPVFWPAMQGGINAVSAVSAMPPSDALLMINMIPAETGTRVRKGYVEWCESVPLGDGIKTLVPVTDEKSMTDRLFAVTNDGIYDVSLPAVAPTKVLDFAIKSSDAGWASWTHYTTIGGQFVLLADNANGYYVYDVDANTWAAGAVGPETDVTLPFNASLVVHVMVWKNRVWLVERNSGRAWYLKVGLVGGTGNDGAKPFNFGNKFKFGGFLKSLWNWTLDGGEGVDDYLVAISSAGDMLTYRGTDPATIDTFDLKGSWFVGRVMQGRRQAADMGGELLLLSNYGVLQASKLISGQPATDEAVSVSYKVNPRINAFTQRTAEEYGWELIFIPREQIIMLTTPKETGQPYFQFVYNTATRAWTMFRDLPVKTGTMWKNKFYFGTDDNRIHTYEGYLNEVYLDPVADGNFEAIEWETLTGFQGFNEPAIYKRVQFMSPLFIGQSNPVYKIIAKYDFNLAPPAGPAVFPPTSGGIWDAAIWDLSLWGGGYVTSRAPKGGSGMGRYVALYMRGRVSSELVHVGTDVLFDSGGML